MRNRVSRAEQPVSAAGLRLEVIWDVDEDASYDVSWRRERDLLIAIRTLAGAGRMELGAGREVVMEAATLFVVSAPEVRRYHCLGDRWRFWWFEFVFGGSMRLPREQPIRVAAAPGDEAAFEEAFATLHRSTPAQPRLASAVFDVMLCRWLAAWEGEQRRRCPYQDRIERALDLMHRRLGDGLTVREMARAVNMGERNFRKAFRHVTGQSPKRTYDRLRLQTADELLRVGAYAVGDVAEQMGFSSPFHFSKAYRRHFGFPPREARSTGHTE
ncbi:MAG: helix-turn-helix transcriptional regulator [Kiritimatiellae bacterium]|nr:helix-turn-helix transcriptional regulator [Kiritimatiellia bacterium]